MSLSPAYDRRGAIGLLWKSALSVPVLAACGAFQRRVVYYSHDELADLIRRETGVCVGVGDVSIMGASYFEDMRVRQGVANDATRDYYRRCSVQPLPDEFGKDVRMVWIPGGSVDQHGERKGSAAVAVPRSATEKNPDILDTIVDIAVDAGVRYVDRSDLWSGMED